MQTQTQASPVENPFRIAAYFAPFDAPLGGRWIDLEGRDKDDVMAEVEAVFGEGTETRVYDIENIPACVLRDGVLVPETWDFLALDDGEQATVWAYWEHVDSLADVKYALESYSGTGDNPKDWAWDWLEETGDLQSIPAHLRNYFDFDAFVHDLECDGWVFARHDGDLFVFRPV